MSVANTNQNINKFNCDLTRINLISEIHNCFDELNETRGLKIVHFNSRSINNKLDQIRIFCAIIKPHVLCIT